MSYMRPTQKETDIVSAYKSGLSLRKAAKKLGISHERVRQVLLEHGEPIRWQGTPEKNAKIPAAMLGKSLLQELVDGAHSLLSIDAARQYKLITGGPVCNYERCIEIIEAGKARGIEPRRDAFKRFLKQSGESP